MSYLGFSLNFNRDFQDATGPQFDRITIHSNHHQAGHVPDETIDQINALINAIFLGDPDQATVLFANPKAFEKLIASHQEMRKRLEGMATNVTEETAIAQIGPNGAEFEMNGRGASKLADKIQHD